MKRLFLLLFVATIGMCVAMSQPPKREFRSVWMAAMGIDWPLSKYAGTTESDQAMAKASLIEYLDNFDRENFTGICLHVRPMADALYKSTLEPWSSSVSGTRGVDPGWDPLAFAVEECHKRGLEIYAWVNPFRITNAGYVYTTEYDLEWREKGWELTSGDWTIFNPAIKEARQHCLDVIKEIYTNYEVDGMLFDDYFYPGSGMASSSAAGDYEQYLETGNGMTIGDWRRNNVNTFVKEVYDMIQADRPDMRFGIGPAGVAGASAWKYDLSKPSVGSDWMYDKIYCDPLAWLKDGSIDFISPQIYWARSDSSTPFGPLAKWWGEVAEHFGRHYYVSMASYKLDTSEFGGNNEDGGWSEMSAQITLGRNYTLSYGPGQIYFSAKTINGPELSGLGDHLSVNSYQRMALVPIVDWKEHKAYAAPANPQYADNTLRWTATAKEGKEIIRYSIYAIPFSTPFEEAMSATGDGISGEYLIDVSYSAEYSIPDAYQKGFYYAVCVYDGYGYESEPTTFGYTGERTASPALLTPENGANVGWDVDLSWTEVAGAEYIVQLSYSSEFTSVFAQYEVTTNRATLDLGSLQSGITLYWRVVATEPQKLYGFSEPRSFVLPTRTTGEAPLLLRPAEGDVISDKDVAFEWQATSEATRYLVQIARPNDFVNPIYREYVDAPTTSVTLNATALGTGDFSWRVWAYGPRILETGSAVVTFTLNAPPIGSYESGYTIAKDPTDFVEVNDILVKSVWFRSVAEGYNNIAFEDNGTHNRGMAASADYVYIAGRSEETATAAAYLRQYSAATGEHIRDIALSSDASVTNLPCNNVFTDALGNVYIANQTTNGVSRPIYLQKVDLTNGEVSDEVRLKGNKTVVSRIDNIGIFGDIDYGEYTVFAAVASKGSLVRWTVNNGEAECEVMPISEFYPATLKNFGAAPYATAVSESLVYIDGGNSTPTLYDFETGSIVSTFEDAGMGVNTTDVNGMAVFTIGERTFAVFADDYASFKLAEMTSVENLSSMTQIATFPGVIMGTNNSETNVAPIATAEIDAKTVRVFIYSPGNGLAAYDVTDTEGASVSDVTADTTSFRVDGKTIRFTTIQNEIRVYTPMGALVAQESNASSIEVPAAGLYLLNADGNSALLRIK